METKHDNGYREPVACFNCKFFEPIIVDISGTSFFGKCKRFYKTEKKLTKRTKEHVANVGCCYKHEPVRNGVYCEILTMVRYEIDKN